MTGLMAFENPNDPSNSARHLTGKVCIEHECDNPAGTEWSPLLCFECNVKRIKRLNEQFTKLFK